MTENIHAKTIRERLRKLNTFNIGQLYINYKRSHSNFTEIAIFHDRLMKKTARFSKVKLTVDQATVKLDYYYYFLKFQWELELYFY